MPKRIVVSSDGTWNTPDQRHPTNVVKMSHSIVPTAPDGKSQVVFYDPGVGTGNLLDRLTGGAFGHGLDKNIEDAYRFLMNNYDEGDQVYLFGFSRGAYTARSTAGLIRNAGLLRKAHADRFPDAFRMYQEGETHPDSDEAKEFKRAYSREIEIWFIGVWDTVGARGIPLRGLRALMPRRYRFFDTELSRYVRHGYHAVAIDERRGPFEPTLWTVKNKPGQVVEQVWFAGAHSDIGGGSASAGLSDTAFMWMKEKAEACGLAFDEGLIRNTIHPNALDTLHDSMTGLYRFTLGAVRPVGESETEAAHPDVLYRRENAEPPYRPENLERYLQRPNHKVAVVRYQQRPR